MKRTFKVIEGKSTSELCFTLQSNRPFMIDGIQSDYQGESEHQMMFYGMPRIDILKKDVTIINDDIFTKNLKEKKAHLRGLQHLNDLWIENDFKAMDKSVVNEINELLSEIEDLYFDTNENKVCKKVYDIINYIK